MARKRKWLKVSHAEQPVSRLARRAVRQRLELVWYYLPLAANRPEEDIEHVHQLRVATRRAVAALGTFRELLPRQRAKRIRKALRRIRRAAGEARDVDVLTERLLQVAGEHDADLHDVIGLLRRRRKKAQKPMIKVYRRLRKQRFGRTIAELVQRIRWRGDGDEPTVGHAARTALRPLADEFFHAAAVDLSDLEALHELRISGKRLRYAMELLAGAFPVMREQWYPVFEQMQQRLGQVNDHVTAAAFFQRSYARHCGRAVAAPLKQLARTEGDHAVRAREQFHDWWSADKSRALRCRFGDVLGQEKQVG